MGERIRSHRELDPTLLGMGRKTMKSYYKRKTAVREFMLKDKVAESVLDSVVERQAFRKRMEQFEKEKFGFTAEDVSGVLVDMVNDPKAKFNRKEAIRLGKHILEQSDLSKWRQKKLLQPLYRKSSFRKSESPGKMEGVVSNVSNPDASKGNLPSLRFGASRFVGRRAIREDRDGLQVQMSNMDRTRPAADATRPPVSDIRKAVPGSGAGRFVSNERKSDDDRVDGGTPKSRLYS